MGTFTVTIDADRVGAGTETSAQLQVQFAAGRTAIKDSTGDRFIFPHTTAKEPTSIQLPTTLILETDVAAGAPANSEDIGYRIIVTVPLTGGKIDTGEFAARPADTVIDLTDLVADFTGSIAESIAVRAEVARDEAEAAQVAAEAAAAAVNPGAPNGTATLDGDGNLPETQVPDRLSAANLDIDFVKHSEVDTAVTTVDANAASAFRVQQDARQQAAMDTRARRLYLTGQTLSSVQTWLTALPSGARGQLVGSITIAGTLTVPAGVTLDLTAASITQTTETVSTIILGADSKLVGGTITNPAVFDTTTGAWTFGVVYITGDGAVVDGVTLENVPHVGIGIKEADDATVTNCRIVGNFPSASYTGVETGHYGIALDANVWSTGTASGPILTNNHIQSCVQGISLVNHGTGAGYGAVVVGNRFYGCYNHGIYSQIGMEADTITGNAFFFCQKPVVTTGRGHVVADNTMFSIGTGTQRDQAGISCRNAEGCVVEGNTILGEGVSTNIAIQLDQNGSGVETVRNAIIGNTIRMTGAGGGPVIRVGNSSSTTTCRENRVADNIIHAPGPGATNAGLIEVTIAVGQLGTNNSVDDNTLVCTSTSSHIRLERQVYASVRGNHLRHDADAGSASTVMHVRLETTSDSTVEGNTCVVTSSWGANTTFYGVREMSSACDRNTLGPNTVRHSLTKAVASHDVLTAGAATMAVNRLGKHAAATTLGSVTGKLEVRDGKGTVIGYTPVYGSIT